MHFIAFTQNDIVTKVDTMGSSAKEFDSVPVWVIMHKEQMMCTPMVIGRLIEKWKKTFHPSELPVSNYEGSDATEAFLEWLKAQPLGYEVPNTWLPLCSVPIFDALER